MTLNTIGPDIKSAASALTGLLSGAASDSAALTAPATSRCSNSTADQPLTTLLSSASPSATTESILADLSSLITGVMQDLAAALTAIMGGDSAAQTSSAESETSASETVADTDTTSDSASTGEIQLDPQEENTELSCADVLESFDGTEFAEHLASTLPQTKQIHEEELQHAIVSYLLTTRNTQLGRTYDQVYASAITKAGDKACEEDAVNEALQTLVENKQLSTADAQAVNGVSFRAAQLDKHLDMLFDGREGQNDNTAAQMARAKAIKKAQQTMQNLRSGKLQAEPRSLSEGNNKTGIY